MSKRNSLVDNQQEAYETGPVGDTDVVLRTKQVQSSDSSLLALAVIVLGTLPNANFDKFVKSTSLNGSIMYVFSYENVDLYQVEITDPYGDHTVQISSLSLGEGIFLLEDGTGGMLLEDDSGFIKLEGA